MVWNKRILRIASAGVGALLLVSGAQGAARADEPKTAAEAQLRVAQLEQEHAQIEARYNAAQERYTRAVADADAKRAELSDIQHEITQLRVTVGEFAMSQYKQAGFSTAAQALTDPERFLRNADVASKYADNQSAAIAALAQKQGIAADTQRAIDAQVAAANSEKSKMASLETDSRHKIAEARAVVDRLSAPERAAYDARQAQAAAALQEASRTAAARVAQTTTPAAPANTTSAAALAPTPTATAQIAINYALAQLGAPYALGGTGPAYDCSGLVMMAYRSAGISLPRTSEGQIASGRSVSMSDLQPGDIIGYYGGGHVAIYLGDGQVVHALNYGTPLSVTSLTWVGQPTSATRVA